MQLFFTPATLYCNVPGVICIIPRDTKFHTFTDPNDAQFVVNYCPKCFELSEDPVPCDETTRFQHERK